MTASHNPTQAGHSFEEVIETNKRSLFRICSVYAVVPMEPQDLFQEVLFQAWKSWDRFQGRSAPGTWLYRIALNVCMAAKYKVNRDPRPSVQLDAIAFQLEDDPPDEHAQAQHQALRACIEALGEADRSLVVLYLEELPYREIASITGLTENHVAVKMKRIRAKLFDCITQKLAP